MTTIEEAFTDVIRNYKKAEEDSRDKAARSRASGFLHAASDHERLANVYKHVQDFITLYLGVTREKNAAESYPVSRSVLIEEIAKNDYWLKNDSLEGWTSDPTTAEYYIEEATAVYDFLVRQGWTPPTV